ncbi:hypothetical protein [Halobellus sp. GM3]|uniref:hypothetical protein n=1 Tax=Halobellus sp. GM3 TaxID=3458410 RepID=UPI00403DDB9F
MDWGGVVAFALGALVVVTGITKLYAESVTNVRVACHVVDERAGEPYDGADAVVAERVVERDGDGDGGGDPESTSETEARVELDGGVCERSLPPGTWRFSVIEGERTITEKSTKLVSDIGSERVLLAVPPREVPIRVTGGLDSEPLEGATVTVEPDVGGETELVTDADGSARVELPRSAATVAVTAAYEGIPDETTKLDVEDAVRNGVSLEIAPGVGTLEIETTVGSRGWPGVEVDITPVGGDATAYADPGTIPTDGEGRMTVTELPTGRYELSAHPTLSAVETARVTETATVAADETTAVTLSIETAFSLSNAQRERRSELRERIEGLSAARNRDAAIPYYYGTVLESVLGLVEAIGANPERAFETDEDLTAVVDALLDATGDGIDVVDEAMSDRRNQKLFHACESIPSVEASWGGDVDLESFFERIERGAADTRADLRDRLEETDELLNRQWSEVVEIRPVRRVHECVRDHAVRTGGVDDELTAIARGFVGVCLLDAVASFFERDALVDRLNSGVY